MVEYKLVNCNRYCPQCKQQMKHLKHKEHEEQEPSFVICFKCERVCQINEGKVLSK